MNMLVWYWDYDNQNGEWVSDPSCKKNDRQDYQGKAVLS
jgi:hypothetical protein